MGLVEHDTLGALDQLVQALERRWLPAYPDSDRFYGYEPLPLSLFLRGLELVGPPAGRRFLDVGCGIGTKLLLARLRGWTSVAGLEVHPPYARVARKLCPDDVTLTVGDAFEFDGYPCADVVYMYRPAIGDELELELERHVVSRMRPGALAFFPCSVGRSFGRELGDRVWQVR